MPSMQSWLQILGQGSGLLVAGLILLVLTLIALVATVANWISGGRHDPYSARRRHVSLTGGLIRLLTVLVFLFSSLSLLLAGAALRTYTVFTHEEKIGTLECLQRDDPGKTFIVRFIPLRAGQPARPATFTLYGDQWEVSAHILKWTPKTIQFGVHTAYRLNMLKGIYQQAGDETRLPHQAYALSTGPDWIWSLLTRFGQRLPFVEAVYGNAVSNPARPGDQFDIFVTTSGLSTRRKEP